MHSDLWDSFSFSSAGKKKEEKDDSVYEPFSPEDFKKRKASGKFQRLDSITHDLLEEG